MFSATLENLVRGLNGVRAFVRTGDALRRLVLVQDAQSEPSFTDFDLQQIKLAAPSQADWRVSDHTASIGRLYALFEQFVEELLASWISFQANGTPYNQLPEGFRKQYEAGFAHILSQAGEGRYDHLTMETMIAQQAKALAGDADYRLFPECLTFHTKNFRWDTLLEVTGRCGIDDLSTWLSRSHHLIEYFETRTSITEQIQSRLKTIVQYRNDAAHASVSVDQIIGVEAFLDHSDFIEALCRGFIERIHHKAVDVLVQRQMAREVGRVAWVSGDRRIVVGNIEGVSLAVGHTLIFKSGQSCCFRAIESIQLDGVDMPQIVVANALELGLRLDGQARLNDSMLVVLSEG